MPVNVFNTTTLSEALTNETKDFTVASTANITAGDLLKIRGELVKVQAIPVSGRVQVMRGVGGTEARAHPNSQRIFIIANPEDVKVNTKQQLALIGASGVYPDYLFPGQVATDDDGNEYILVSLASTAYAGTTVSISLDGLYSAVPLVGGAQGPVGLLVEANTSNQYAWAQRYGFNSYAQESTGTSGASSVDIAVAATSVSTPDVGLVAYAVTSTTADRYRIYGMFIRGAATTATTSATSATGVAVPVFLNYPYVTSLRETITTS